MRFGIRLPIRVLFDADLTPEAKLVYGVIAAVKHHDPSYDDLQDSLGMGRKRIAKAILELADHGDLQRAMPARLIRINGQPRDASRTKYTLYGTQRYYAWVSPDRVML